MIARLVIALSVIAAGVACYTLAIAFALVKLI